MDCVGGGGGYLREPARVLSDAGGRCSGLGAAGELG